MSKKILILVTVIAVLAAANLLYFNNRGIGLKAAEATVKEFVSKNLVQEGTKVEVKEAKEENGMYKIVLKVETEEITTFLSKDGKNFFPQAMNIEEYAKQVDSQKKQAEEKVKEVPKSEKPQVELFVMSYCPYGTQIEKGILPVLETLKDKIDFKLRFVSYAMHDQKEIDENLTQYCIQKEQPEKLASYLTCFLKDSKSADCLKAQSVDETKLQACVKATDAKFKIKEQYLDKNAWNGQFPPFDVDKELNEKYGVQGSPSLVVNGVETSAKRDPASLLKTICSAFNNQPEECSKELSSTAPSAGFGEGTGSNSGGGCAE